jgi:hypothetical protein
VDTYDDHSEDSQATAPAYVLTVLQEEFPKYQIWRENVPGRRRYVARSQHLSVNPHTVITADPDELRAALSRPA